jgi:glycosyltransferase involved in cell wall biosynthesis
VTSRALVVVPAWNEATSVGHVVNEVLAQHYDVVVVDDGSTDGTAAVAETAGATVLRLPVNLGVGAALRCGFRYAVERGYGAVIQVDADGQHPATAIALLEQVGEETPPHLVTGSRFAGADAGMTVGRLRRFVMSVLARSATKATATTITDATSGFRLIREPLLSQFARTFPAHYLGDTYEAVVSAGRAGYIVREVPVSMRERSHGESSASPMAAVRFTVRAMIVAGTRLHFSIEPWPPRPHEAAS